MPTYVSILDLIDFKNLSVFDAVRKLFFIVRFPKDNAPGETGRARERERKREREQKRERERERQN